MMLKELVMKVDFDSLLPYLEKWENRHLDNIYAFREAYDILRGMEPDRDCRGKATVTTSIKEDGTKSTRVSSLDDDVWERELAKEFVFPDGLSVSMEELAMHCLWEIAFYGFPGSTFTRSDVEFLLGVDYGVRYDYYSVGCGTNGRLDYILEPMTKYQQQDLARHDNAVVFVLYPSRYPLEDLEVEAFRKAVHKRLGYENVMLGTAVTENVKVMLLLNRTA